MRRFFDAIRFFGILARQIIDKKIVFFCFVVSQIATIFIVLNANQNFGVYKMRQYPIWNNIQSCSYANKTGKTGNKSYGVKEHNECQILIGTSARNSHEFLTHKVTHRQHENGDREYRFYIDDVCVKIGVLRKNQTEIEITKNLIANH